jgi:hypothetical protein
MQQAIRRLTVVALGALALPALAGAQRPEPRELPRADATRIINMRRELDLTARQLTQLDSIERATVNERRANAERMRARRDSMRPRNDSLARSQMRERARAGGTPEGRLAMRDSMRARMEAMRPEMERMRRTDSTRREAAERVLNDSQRQRLREIQAEERGRQRGLREARGARRGGAGQVRVRPGGRAGMAPGGRRPGSVRERPAMVPRMAPRERARPESLD